MAEPIIKRSLFCENQCKVLSSKIHCSELSPHPAVTCYYLGKNWGIFFSLYVKNYTNISRHQKKVKYQLDEIFCHNSVTHEIQIIAPTNLFILKCEYCTRDPNNEANGIIAHPFGVFWLIKVWKRKVGKYLSLTCSWNSANANWETQRLGCERLSFTGWCW